MFSGFHHVKLPVSAVARSRDWYTGVLGFTTDVEFVEDGMLMGVGLAHAGMAGGLPPRHQPHPAKAPSGFRAVALLDGGGEPHGGIVTGHRGGAVLVGLHDPDGIEIRLYAD